MLCKEGGCDGGMIFKRFKVGDIVEYHLGIDKFTGVVKSLKGDKVVVDTDDLILEFKKKELKKI